MGRLEYGSHYEEQYLGGSSEQKKIRANGEVISWDAETKESAPVLPLPMKL